MFHLTSDICCKYCIHMGGYEVRVPATDTGVDAWTTYEDPDVGHDADTKAA